MTMTPAKWVANRANAKMRCRPGSLLRQLFAHYKQSAARRGLSFSLTIKEFESLVTADCFYCGQIPSRAYRPSRYVDVYLSNGVDRVNNFLGYDLKNCVPCCKVCNQFKSNLTVDEMLQTVRRIFERHMRIQ